MRIDKINKKVKDGYAWMALSKRKRKRIMRSAVRNACRPEDKNTEGADLYADHLAGRITWTYEEYGRMGLSEEEMDTLMSTSFDKIMMSIIIQQKAEINEAKARNKTHKTSILEVDPYNN